MIVENPHSCGVFSFAIRIFGYFGENVQRTYVYFQNTSEGKEEKTEVKRREYEIVLVFPVSPYTIRHFNNNLKPIISNVLVGYCRLFRWNKFFFSLVDGRLKVSSVKRHKKCEISTEKNKTFVRQYLYWTVLRSLTYIFSSHVLLRYDRSIVVVAGLNSQRVEELRDILV